MRRLNAMIVKEMWAALRDPKARITLILPALMQLFIFSYATTLDVRNVDIAVLDRSGGVHANELVQRLAGSTTFREVEHIASTADLRRVIDDQVVIAAIVIDPDFDRRVTVGQPATVGIVLDGRRSNAAQIVSGYISRIAIEMGVEARAGGMMPTTGTAVTNWYNPTLDYMWFTIPSLVAIITMIGAVSVTSQSIARERELGTFDQLMVSPLRVHEIIIGKMVPPFLISLFNGTLYLLLSPLFGVPFTGSVLLFYLGLTFYALSLVGVGLFVSALCGTQQQAFLGSFLISTPLIMLSGYASPIENMPGWMQIMTYADPVRYFLVIVQGQFLKAMPAAAVLSELWPLVLIACLTLGVSAWLFRARME